MHPDYLSDYPKLEQVDVGKLLEYVVDEKRNGEGVDFVMLTEDSDWEVDGEYKRGESLFLEERGIF